MNLKINNVSFRSVPAALATLPVAIAWHPGERCFVGIESGAAHVSGDDSAVKALRAAVDARRDTKAR